MTDHDVRVQHRSLPDLYVGIDANAWMEHNAIGDHRVRADTHVRTNAHALPQRDSWVNDRCRMNADFRYRLRRAEQRQKLDGGDLGVAHNDQGPRPWMSRHVRLERMGDH